MGTDEIKALVSDVQAQLDAEQTTYENEKRGIDHKIQEIRQSIEFNRKEAQKIRDYGGDDKQATDFEQKAETLERELATQEQDMKLALSRKKQNIDAIKSTLESRASKLEDAEDREKVMNLIATAIRYGTG